MLNVSRLYVIVCATYSNEHTIKGKGGLLKYKQISKVYDFYTLQVHVGKTQFLFLLLSQLCTGHQPVQRLCVIVSENGVSLLRFFFQEGTWHQSVTSQRKYSYRALACVCFMCFIRDALDVIVTVYNVILHLNGAPVFTFSRTGKSLHLPLKPVVIAAQWIRFLGVSL